MAVVYVKDKTTFDIIRIEENYSSLVWTERYQEPGEFVLSIPISEANFDVYRRGNYVILDDSTYIMVIETLNINDEVEDPLLEVSGRSLSSILDRRINASRLLENYASTIEYSGDLGSVMSDIFKDEIQEPFMEVWDWVYWKWYDDDEEPPADAIYTGTYLGRNYYKRRGYGPRYPEPGYEDVFDRQKEKFMEPADYRKIENLFYENLCEGVTVEKKYNKLMTILDILQSMAKEYVFGFKMIIDEEDRLVLQTFKGVDRTSKQKTLDPVIFNPVMDNIVYVNYYEDQTNYKNVALSYSDGCWSPVDYNETFSDMVFSGYVWVQDDGGDGGSGTKYLDLNRHELPVDARSEASVANYDPYEFYYGTDPTTGEDTGVAVDEDGNPTWIVDKVKAVATAEFETEEYKLIKTSEGAIDPLVRYQYGVNYFIGDIVEISNDRGVVMTAIIDEVVRSYDADGYIVTPNFKNMEEYDYGEEDAV